MVLEIEPSFLNRGAVVSEFSQYPKEEETLFLPMSYVAQSWQRRVEHSTTGEVTVIPVRVSVNLKVERVEQLEEKKSIHLTWFEFRVNEVRQRLQRLMEEGGAEARLKKDKDSQGCLWKKAHSVEGYVEAQVKKVEAVLLRHRERAAEDYSNDDVYRKLVSESLEAASMAQSAVLWWLRDRRGTNIYCIEDNSLLLCQRRYESFLILECNRSGEAGAHRAAVMELCHSRNLLRVDVSERDENGESPLIALAALGGSADDLRLLVAAGADVGAVAEWGTSAMFFAARQGHAEMVEVLARAGADCNQADTGGRTPLWTCSSNGHLRCVQVLLKEEANMNNAGDDGSTPLLYASQNGHCDVVDALLRWGADVNKAKNDCSTPLCIASCNGHCDVVDALVRGGAGVNKARNDGTTPLYPTCLYTGST
jgi:ankyrin repeat protein